VAPSGGGSGTVTAVTGTAPVVSSGGATPAISMPAATTSVDGYLSHIDWNTFNGKQAALGFTPAHSGANSDITSLSGLTTPISAAQGATGINTSSSTGSPQVASGTWSVANPAFAAVSISSYAGTLATGGAYQTNGTVALSHLSTTTINVTGLVSGAAFNLLLTQDSTGGDTLTLGTGCTWKAGTNAGFVASTTPALTAVASGINILSAIYDGTYCWYNVR